MRLASLTRPELIFPGLPGVDPSTVLRAFAERMAARRVVADADSLYRKLWEREQLGSTGIGAGVAVPHCKVKGLEQVVMAVGLTDRPVDFGGADGRPVRLFFVVVSPDDAPAAHLHCLAAISRWVKNGSNVERMLQLAEPVAMYQLLEQQEA